MADISRITLPGGSAYDLKDAVRGVEFIKGTQTAATGSWTGTTNRAALFDGMQIKYFLPYAGSGNATLNLTLSGGTATGAKPVYRWGTTYATTHFKANSVVDLTYSTKAVGTGAWYVSSQYDDGNTTYTAATATPSAIGTAAVGTSAKYAREDHVHNISLATGDSNGQVKIAGTNVSVKGWNTAATYAVETTLANDAKLPTGAAVTTALGNYLPLSGGTVTGTLILSRNQDASGTANNKPALIVGGTDTQAHIEIDTDEIMAKSNGTTTTYLYLNWNGGKVVSGDGGYSTKGDVNAVGHMRVGVSAYNTDSGGCKMQFNSSTNALDFIFD